MKEIPLTKGKVAIVDARDYRWLSQYRWYAIEMKPGYFQAARFDYSNGKTCIYMNRQILGLSVGDKRRGDHENGNTLDNRRNNLRIATQSQNGMNRGKQANNKSGFKGVSLHAPTGRWKAQISIQGKNRHIGLYDTPEEAHVAYSDAARVLHGNFARTM